MSLLDAIKKMFGTADTKLQPIIEYHDNGEIDKDLLKTKIDVHSVQKI